MIRITFEEGVSFAQPDGLPRREAELFCYLHSVKNIIHLDQIIIRR